MDQRVRQEAATRRGLERQGSGNVVEPAFRSQPRRGDEPQVSERNIKRDYEERPWGSFETVDRGERYRVKRIVVKPGGQLSLQMHYHRAEHWIIVSGAAVVTRDDMRMLVRENEAVYIPIGMRHRIENPGKTPLCLVEVQVGSYLEEDDIVRLEDRYGRG